MGPFIVCSSFNALKLEERIKDVHCVCFIYDEKHQQKLSNNELIFCGSMQYSLST